MSEGAKRPSESAGEGVAVTGVRLLQVVSFTQPLSRAYRIGWGGRGKLVPGSHDAVSITSFTPADLSGSAGEGAATWCPAVARSRA